MKRLTSLRLARGWSKTELARRARLHPSRVSVIENGRALPYDVELRRLARALKYVGGPRELLNEVTEAHGDQ